MAAQKKEDMTTIGSLAASHGWAAVEFEMWGWAAMLDAETRRTVELALAARGPLGVETLVASGPALGGLDAAQLAEMVAGVEVALGVAAVAA
ncbi:hypothetical protein [Microbacterium sp. RG1]|uniref:hypothetical protein n=1 Tax=Microbacterium sp. RG1 TaxID=2489212 RepID=UPI0010CA3299|nr:hypothetical protein [Microbacterium sp. RG1]QCQ15453.1 hypothetical protein EHF32_01170 [Microbacterium sp. RG1]